MFFFLFSFRLFTFSSSLSNRYEAVLPIHSLWLGYMAEVLSLSLVIPTTFSPVASTSTLPISSTSTTASLIPTFPTKNPTDEDLGIARELNISVANLHSKLVKAEFVGCILTGESLFLFVVQFFFPSFEELILLWFFQSNELRILRWLILLDWYYKKLKERSKLSPLLLKSKVRPFFSPS